MPDRRPWMWMLFGAVMLSATLATAAAPRAARAAACGTFYGTTGSNGIIVGEATSYFWYQGSWWWYGIGKIAVCWTDSDFHYEQFDSCTSGSSSSDWLRIYAYAGDDTLVPNETNHSCEGGYWLDTYMEPFDESIFDLYFYADMGTGADRAHGSDNSDKLYSNTGYPYASDSAEDRLCGWGGSDSLYGDADDSETYEEILVGGAGQSDYCYGGPDGGYYDWAHTSCETRVNASSMSADMCGQKDDLWW